MALGAAGGCWAGEVSSLLLRTDETESPRLPPPATGHVRDATATRRDHLRERKRLQSSYPVLDIAFDNGP